MRTLLLAGAAIASLAGASVEAAKAADIYEPAPGYGAAPPAYEPPPPNYNYGPPPAPAYRPAPRYGYAPPVYGPPPQPAYPPAIAYGDDEEEFAPPPRIYRGPPVYAERPRYRDCWWEYGERRCGPRRGW
jgi:hypothetical protein